MMCVCQLQFPTNYTSATIVHLAVGAEYARNNEDKRRKLTRFGFNQRPRIVVDMIHFRTMWLTIRGHGFVPTCEYCGKIVLQLSNCQCRDTTICWLCCIFSHEQCASHVLEQLFARFDACAAPPSFPTSAPFIEPRSQKRIQIIHAGLI